MEDFLLLVLVVLWVIVRSRDRKQREAAESELRYRLDSLDSELRALRVERVAATVPPPPQEWRGNVVASPNPPPLFIRSDETIAAAVRKRAEQGQFAEPAAPETSPDQNRTSQKVAESESRGPVLSGFTIAAEPELPAEAASKRAASLEERLGANWLNKLGIVILVFGVAFFLAYQLKNLGPLGKIVVGFAVSATLLAGGLILEKRNKYQIFARAGIGGGWALTFFTTYAMYHVPATRVLSSQAIDLILMFIVAVGMVWHSLRYRSQVVTGLAFLLAFSTITISQVTVFSLVAIAVLAAGLVFVTSREHWAELELAGLVGVYLSHFFWVSRILHARGGSGHPFPEFFPSAALILLYWLIFRIAYVHRTPRDEREDLLTSITAVLNSAGVLGLLKYQSAHPEWAFWALLALGAAEMLLAFYVRFRRRTAFVVLSTIATALLLAAIPFHYRGAHWSLFWILEVEVLFLSGIRMREPVFRRLGILAGFAAAFQLGVGDILPLYSLRATQPDAGWHWGATFALAFGAVAYWFNSEVAPRRWNELASADGDFLSLRITSYLGLLSAMGCLWALFPGSETVVAWMVLALSLGYLGDKFDLDGLGLQCDLVAAAAFLRVLVINFSMAGHRFGLSQRALTVGVVSVLFYIGTRRKSSGQGLLVPYIALVYSWAGTLLLALLIWFELRPVSIAVGWGVLALLLLEIGILRDRFYLRHQALLLLAASFVRIFFVNLNAGDQGNILNPRIYTVLPLIAAYFWAYERMRQASGDSRIEQMAGVVACCFGTTALAALLYFEMRPEWVVISWAVMVPLLLILAWALDRRLFLAQGLVMAVAVFARSLLFNLTTQTLAQSSLWQRRAACIGIASAILLAALPLAFRLRNRGEVTRISDGWGAGVKFSFNRPEQILFFIPLLLVTILLAFEMRAGMITVAWSAVGVSVFLFALMVHERSYRLAGLGLLLLGVGKILLIDIWKLAPTDRYVTLIVMGIALLLVSFLYTRYREVILKFL